MYIYWTIAKNDASACETMASLKIGGAVSRSGPSWPPSREGTSIRGARIVPIKTGPQGNSSGGALARLR